MATTMSQESIEYIPPSEDIPQGKEARDAIEASKLTTGKPDAGVTAETMTVIPVSGPVTGQLSELLSDMPETGLPAEAEDSRKMRRNGVGQANYAEPGKRWEPTKLTSRHREIMRRMLEGASPQDIAIQMGLHPHTITIISTSQMFREELGKLEVSADFSVIKRAEDLSNEALDTLKTNMRYAQRAGDRIKASIEILGIGGYSKIEKKVVGVVNGEEVIKRLNEMRRKRIMGEDKQEATANG